MLQILSLGDPIHISSVWVSTLHIVYPVEAEILRQLAFQKTRALRRLIFPISGWNLQNVQQVFRFWDVTISVQHKWFVVEFPVMKRKRQEEVIPVRKHQKVLESVLERLYNIPILGKTISTFVHREQLHTDLCLTSRVIRQAIRAQIYTLRVQTCLFSTPVVPHFDQLHTLVLEHMVLDVPTLQFRSCSLRHVHIGSCAQSNVLLEFSNPQLQTLVVHAQCRLSLSLQVQQSLQHLVCWWLPPNTSFPNLTRLELYSNTLSSWDQVPRLQYLKCATLVIPSNRDWQSLHCPASSFPWGISSLGQLHLSHCTQEHVDSLMQRDWSFLETLVLTHGSFVSFVPKCQMPLLSSLHLESGNGPLDVQWTRSTLEHVLVAAPSLKMVELSHTKRCVLQSTQVERVWIDQVHTLQLDGFVLSNLDWLYAPSLQRLELRRCIQTLPDEFREHEEVQEHFESILEPPEKWAPVRAQYTATNAHLNKLSLYSPPRHPLVRSLVQQRNNLFLFLFRKQFLQQTTTPTPVVLQEYLHQHHVAIASFPKLHTLTFQHCHLLHVQCLELPQLEHLAMSDTILYTLHLHQLPRLQSFSSIDRSICVTLELSHLPQLQQVAWNRFLKSVSRWKCDHVPQLQMQ